ncbi:hypothetical protein EV193_104364 [Herbihabitans rhizosphaerae]|uniref:Uncharacterized protein n=1 Tax=Herbihabitans rhizosphaerae TaxID=1872711 RepID=A0A4Q7KQN0_9PSEU|nr:hypothetical protein EV193_104364 [Herbihabitans rhizosphaerae]
MHRFLGNETNHRILVRKANRYDWFVILEGPAPIPVEYGHIAEDGTRVEGLRILRGAFDM